MHILETRMVKKTSIRTYSELKLLQTFEQRYTYLQLGGRVGEETFGFDRYLNQRFYRSYEWRRIRNEVVVRDQGCDLGIVGRPIAGRILVHHINPLSPDELEDDITDALDPEYLVCVSHLTHNAIHYGDESFLPKDPVIRKPFDMCPWR